MPLGPLRHYAKRSGIAKSTTNVRALARALLQIRSYFFSARAGSAILASRKNRAASSGGVGLM
jgi:hypothetical protein